MSIYFGILKECIPSFLSNFFFSSNYPLGWMNLGISYVANGLYEDALAAYLKADELKPNNGKIIFNLGNLVRKLYKLLQTSE